HIGLPGTGEQAEIDIVAHRLVWQFLKCNEEFLEFIWFDESFSWWRLKLLHVKPGIFSRGQTSFLAPVDRRFCISDRMIGRRQTISLSNIVDSGLHFRFFDRAKFSVPPIAEIPT